MECQRLCQLRQKGADRCADKVTTVRLNPASLGSHLTPGTASLDDLLRQNSISCANILNQVSTSKATTRLRIPNLAANFDANSFAENKQVQKLQEIFQPARLALFGGGHGHAAGGPGA